MENKELIEMAKKAMENAYSPYSNFKVGAALLSKDGQVFLGCNVENASYGATICAERTAITKAVSDGVQDFVKIAVVASSEHFASPCGICRQVLFEFMPNGSIVLEDKEKGIKEFSLMELLPLGFGGKDIKLN